MVERSARSDFFGAFHSLRWAAGGAVVVLLAVGASGAAPAQELRLSASAEQQLKAIMEDKTARTSAQRKISSSLLYELKQRRGDPLMQAVPTLRSRVQVERDGTTLVDMKAEVSDALLRQIEALGGRIVNHSARFKAIRAHLPIDQLEALAQSPDVISIRPADRAITNKIDSSQGDVTHRADVARTDFGVDGTGTKLCALSDGVDSLGTLQGTGDLPAVDVLPGQAGSGSEGTAMLEIMFDLAPGAELGFATAFNGQAGFADNIEALRADGCDVIVDDIFYFAEPVFQDGIIAQAVETVIADGAIYFSSAGNSGNLNDGTSGVWEGDFVDGGDAGAVNPNFSGNRVHDFGSGDLSNQLTANAPFAVTLHWSDPMGASANDYDLCVLDSSLTTIWECSTNFQTGTQDPFEIIGPSFTNERLVVINFAGSAAARYLHLNTIRGQLSIATDGQTAGHAATENVFGVAAVDWFPGMRVPEPFGPPPAGTLPAPFDGTEEVETFSSDGPRRVFYEADGTPITPGNVLAGGGEVRQKPDVTAADGVSTATPGFERFFGTSAAAPHAAAIAGLMLSIDPSLNEDDMRQIFADTALDIEAPGPDRDSGLGILDSVAVLDAILSRAKNDIAVDFGTAEGLWVRYDDGAFSRINSQSPGVMAAGDLDENGLDEVIASFEAVPGLWAFRNNGLWTNVNGQSAEDLETGDLDTDDSDEVVADFGSSVGLWVLYNDSTWSQINSQSPTEIATGDLDENGLDEVVASFGAGVGLWVFRNNSVWVKINNQSAEDLDTGDLDPDGRDEVIIDFGPGVGLWALYNDTSLAKLNNRSPQVITVADLDGNGIDDVVAAFGPGVGLWVWRNNSAWQKLNSQSPEDLETADLDSNGEEDLVVDFGSGGLWAYLNDTSFTPLNSQSPELLQSGNFDGL